MQARGLKRAISEYYVVAGLSRLMQARGLKQSQYHERTNKRQVAPHAGAWIETVASVSDIA